MSLGLSDTEPVVTSQGVMGSLRCANPNCNNVVAQAHLMGVGTFRVLACQVCGRGSEFENTARGWTVKLLPARASVRPQVKR